MHPTGVQLALMSGVISTNAVLLSTPSVAKRIFAPHVGTLLSRYHPQLKLPRIYCKGRHAEQKEQTCKITGNLLKSESFQDPGQLYCTFNLILTRYFIHTNFSGVNFCLQTIVLTFTKSLMTRISKIFVPISPNLSFQR